MSEQPVLEFETTEAFATWLVDEHARVDGVWLKIAKRPETRRRRLEEYVAMLERGDRP